MERNGTTGKKLTDTEKAVIYLHVFGGCDDWKTLYRIARGSDFKNIQERFLDIYISRWKNSPKILEALQEAQQEKNILLAQERTKGIEQGKRLQQEEEQRQEESKPAETTTKKPKTEPLDYSDPKNRKALYNQLIAQAKDDPRTQLDAAKLFEQIQKDDREAAKAMKQNRVYLPLRCHDCPLYKKATK